MARESYLFAIGAIKEAEKRLISEDDMKRMIDAVDAEQSFKVFNDLSYSDELLEIRQPERFSDILAHDLGQVKAFISAMVKDEDLLKLLFAADDFHNLRLVFKAFLKEVDPGGAFSALGYLDPEKLKNFVMNQDREASLGRDYEQIANGAKLALDQSSEPRDIDRYFDKEYFAFILGLAGRLKDSRLRAVIVRQIDNANLKNLVRSRLLGLAGQEARAGLIDGGQFSLGELSACAELDENDIIEKISKMMLDQSAVLELSSLIGKFDLGRLEKALDNRLLRLINEVKMDAAGPAAVYAYYLGKKNETRNIGVIMAGKLNRLSPEEIKGRMRVLY